MKAEIISFRCRKEIADALFYARQKFNLPLRFFLEEALLEYFKNTKEEEIRQKAEYAEFVKRLDEIREKNRRKIRIATLIHNQKKLIKGLKRQGLSPEELQTILEGLKEEAALCGLIAKYEIEEQNILFAEVLKSKAGKIK
jgi:hypothetical protein